jgi:hypothetical protein
MSEERLTVRVQLANGILHIDELPEHIELIIEDFDTNCLTVYESTGGLIHRAQGKIREN